MVKTLFAQVKILIKLFDKSYDVDNKFRNPLVSCEVSFMVLKELMVSHGKHAS